MADVEVRDNETARHWEAVVGGEVAGFAQYVVEGATVTFVHTEVDPRFEGQGIGSAIARRSLDAAREAGLSVVPRCPFYASYIARHEEYADLVAEG